MCGVTAGAMRRTLCLGFFQNHVTRAASGLRPVHGLRPLPPTFSLRRSSGASGRPEAPPPRPRSSSVFMERLSSCASPSDVLDLASRFTPTPPQLSHGLSRMWNSLKKLRAEQRRAEQRRAKLRLMWVHAAWAPLLQRAVGGVSHLPHAHLAYALLALVKLGVGPRTRVVQTYLYRYWTRTGPGLKDWTRTGPGLDQDWTKTGARLDQD